MPLRFPVTLETERLLITQLGPEDAPRVLDYAVRNHDHLAPWQPPASAATYTEAYWRETLAQHQNELESGTALRLVLLDRGNRAGPLWGTCGFTQIFRGSFQACYLGYGLDRDRTGQGIMEEALRAVLPFVFDELGLHRVMANYLPTNERSGRLLRRLGFVVEGYARDYLYIGGAWRDHVLTSITNPRPRAPA